MSVIFLNLLLLILLAQLLWSTFTVFSVNDILLVCYLFHFFPIFTSILGFRLSRVIFHLSASQFNIGKTMYILNHYTAGVILFGERTELRRHSLSKVMWVFMPFYLATPCEAKIIFYHEMADKFLLGYLLFSFYLLFKRLNETPWFNCKTRYHIHKWTNQLLMKTFQLLFYCCYRSTWP